MSQVVHQGGYRFIHVDGTVAIDNRPKVEEAKARGENSPEFQKIVIPEAELARGLSDLIGFPANDGAQGSDSAPSGAQQAQR